MSKQTYISILRGINVSGKNKIPMQDLKALYAEKGFEEVSTYIQSGNVIFKAGDKDEAGLSTIIKEAIEDHFKLKIPVIVISTDHIKKVIDQNPFLKEKNIDKDKLHVTFLEKNPDSAKVEPLQNLDFSPDRFIIIDKTIYLYCPGGYGVTKLSNTFFENKLKVNATTRNWKTVNKLFEFGSQ